MRETFLSSNGINALVELNDIPVMFGFKWKLRVGCEWWQGEKDSNGGIIWTRLLCTQVPSFCGPYTRGMMRGFDGDLCMQGPDNRVIGMKDGVGHDAGRPAKIKRR